MSGSAPAPGKGVKRPRNGPQHSAVDSDSEEGPDLASWFDEFQTPFPERISLCRSYANYLAAQRKARTALRDDQ